MEKGELRGNEYESVPLSLLLGPLGKREGAKTGVLTKESQGSQGFWVLFDLDWGFEALGCGVTSGQGCEVETKS